MEHTLSFSKLDMVWDSAAHAYRSSGQIGIFSIGSTIVNRMVNGFVEYANLYDGDIFTCYLEIEKDKWVFFNYSDGNMQFVTSDSDKALMQAVNDIKEVKRVMKVDKKQAPYKYEVGGDALKRTFVERFRKNRPYIDVMPDLPDPEEQQADKPKKQKEEAVQEEQDDYE